MQSDLLGHWPLDRDAADISSHQRHGEAQGVTFNDEGATFTGRAARIVIPHSPALGDRPFTWSLWVKSPSDAWDSVGDLVSQYDAQRRTGFGLSVKTNTAGNSNTPNVRNAQFWLDAGSEPAWRRCGRPGNSHMVYAMQVHGGHLYAAVHETNIDRRGHVFRYEADEQWTDCGAPDERHGVHSLASVGGQLFASTVCDDLEGSLYNVRDWNLTTGASIYRYEHGDWIDCGNPYGDPPGRISLYNFGDQLFAGNMHHPQIFRYDGDQQWTMVARPNMALISAAAIDGYIYTAAKQLKPQFYPDHKKPKQRGMNVLRFDRDFNVEPVGEGLGGQAYAFTTYHGELIAGTWPRGSTYRSPGGANDWIDAGACGCAELEGAVKGEIMAMATYHGKLYVGTLPLAEVYRYDGDHQWTAMARLDFTPDAPIRRVWSMAEFDGQLFCGTLPGGEVHALRAGFGISSHDALGGGWHHVAAVRDSNTIRLYLDAKLVAEAPADPLDLTCDQPLQLGRGPSKSLTGVLRDVRLYDQPLDPTQITGLAKQTPAPFPT